MTKTSSMLTTTLTRIRSAGPCADGWRDLVRYLGPDWSDDEPIALTTILEVNGLDDAIWCLRACDGGLAVAAEFASWCATRAADAVNAAATAAEAAARAVNASAAYDATRAADRADAAARAADVAANAANAASAAIAAAYAAIAAAYAALAAAEAADAYAAYVDASVPAALAAAYDAERAQQAEHLRGLIA